MRTLCKTFGLIVTVLLVVSCAPAAPTPAPTQAPGPVTPSASVPLATAAVPKPAVAATSVPTAAPAATLVKAAAIKRGGTLVRIEVTEPNTWDPIFSVQDRSFIESPAFEPPLRYELADRNTGKFEIKPELAESWEVVNPTTITLKFRNGIKFHDGSEFTAEVAKWNLDRARTDPKSLAKTYVAPIKSIDVVDAWTIRLNLNAPSATLLLNMTKAPGGTGSTGTFMISKEAFEKQGAEAIGRKPYGTGPFYMDQWLKDDRAIYKRWDQYWRKGEDGQALPYLDGVVIRVVRDQSVAMIELRSGNAHVMASIPAKDASSVKSASDMVLEEWPWAGSPAHYGFNPADSLWGNNLKLRQAAQYAIDKDAIAKTVGLGLAVPDNHYHWMPGWPGWDESLPYYNFDLNKAQQLLKDAGYANGVSGGMFDFVTTSGSGKQTAEIVQQMWAKAGIKVELRGLDNVTRKELVKSGAPWQATSSQNSPSPDPDGFARKWASDGGANYTNYNNPQVDKLLIEGRSTYDFNQRHEIYRKVQRLLFEDALNSGLYISIGNMAFRKEVQGLRVQYAFIDLRDAWLDK